MRAQPLILAAVGLALSACVGSTVRTFTPISEAAVKFQKPFDGQLILTDNRRLHVSDGRLLAEWVCGDRSGYADVCVEKSQIKGIEIAKYRPSAFELFWAALMSPVILISVDSAQKHAREAQLLEREDLEQHRLAIEHGSRPNTPLNVWRAGKTVSDCMRQAGPDPEEARTQTLAAEIWRDRERCLDYASDWYALTAEPAKARTLYFVHAARQRYENLACGLKDQGLRAPRPELVSAAPAGWMEEYESILQKPGTYDYVVTTKCNTTYSAALDSDGFPLEAARADALEKATSSFPLTEFAERE